MTAKGELLSVPFITEEKKSALKKKKKPAAKTEPQKFNSWVADLCRKAEKFQSPHSLEVFFIYDYRKPYFVKNLVDQLSQAWHSGPTW